MRTNNHQYTTEDIQLSRNHLKLSQDKFFHSATNSLQRGIKLDSKCKIRWMRTDYSNLVVNFRNTNKTGFAKSSNHFARQGQNCSLTLGTCPSNMESFHRTDKSLH